MIRVGPAGWSYPDWEGTVYPIAKPVGFHPLSYLARFFDCIEVNSTFYAMPRREHAQRWAKLVEAHTRFRFVVKLNSSFTHEPESAANATDDRWMANAEQFSRGIEPLQRARRLSAMLVQFPLSFLYGKTEVRRLGRLRTLFPDIPLVLELRNHSWFTPPALDTVRGLAYSLAYIDLPPAWNHPPPWHPPIGRIGYLRLHGRNSESWFRPDASRDEKYDYLYSKVEIEKLSVQVRVLEAQHPEVIVVTNNHVEGKAVANALEILANLRNEPVPAPAEIVDAYPHLKGRARIAGQQPLF